MPSGVALFLSLITTLFPVFYTIHSFFAINETIS